MVRSLLDKFLLLETLINSINYLYQFITTSIIIDAVIQRVAFLGSSLSPMGWYEELGRFYFSCKRGLGYAQR